jgi:hypothetical protein
MTGMHVVHSRPRYVRGLCIMQNMYVRGLGREQGMYTIGNYQKEKDSDR